MNSVFDKHTHTQTVSYIIVAIKNCSQAKNKIKSNCGKTGRINNLESEKKNLYQTKKKLVELSENLQYKRLHLFCGILFPFRWRQIQYISTWRSSECRIFFFKFNWYWPIEMRVRSFVHSFIHFVSFLYCFAAILEFHSENTANGMGNQSEIIEETIRERRWWRRWRWGQWRWKNSNGRYKK